MSGSIECEELDMMLKGLFAMAGTPFDSDVISKQALKILCCE